MTSPNNVVDEIFEYYVHEISSENVIFLIMKWWYLGFQKSLAL